MKVACISHGSIVGLNRRPYDLLRSAHGIDITVITPDTWAGDLPAPTIHFTPEPGGADCRALPVRRSGNGSLFTLKGLSAALKELKPDLVLLDEEPWSLAAWQTLRARDSRLQPRRRAFARPTPSTPRSTTGCCHRRCGWKST